MLPRRATDVRSCVEKIRSKGDGAVRIHGCCIDFCGYYEGEYSTVSEMLRPQEFLYLVDLPVERFDPADYALNIDKRIIVDVPWLHYAIHEMIGPLLGGWSTSDGLPGWYRNRSEVVLAGHACAGGLDDGRDGMTIIDEVTEYLDLTAGFEISSMDDIDDWIRLWQGKGDERGHLYLEKRQDLIERCRRSERGRWFPRPWE